MRKRFKKYSPNYIQLFKSFLIAKALYRFTHSHVVNGNMVETSKAVSFRLYELDKLLTDDSKFWYIFQYTY